jgi:transposase
VNSTNTNRLEPVPTEVTTKAKRRRFSAEYKQRILKEVDAFTERGQLGALLRREGLYSSHLIEWRGARERGEIAGLTPKKRGPKAAEVNPLARTVAEQQREIAELEASLKRAELVCAVQKKLSELLGVTLPEPPPEDDGPTKRRP